MDNYYFHMDNLSVGYNRKALIHDICIGIKKGEIVTLIGPNGSGKSTILKSITRQLQIIGGKVYFDNQNLLSFTFRDLSTRMAVVLTERMKPELMTCHDIVATGRYPYTGKQIHPWQWRFLSCHPMHAARRCLLLHLHRQHNTPHPL